MPRVTKDKALFKPFFEEFEEEFSGFKNYQIIKMVKKLYEIVDEWDKKNKSASHSAIPEDYVKMIKENHEFIEQFSKEQCGEYPSIPAYPANFKFAPEPEDNWQHRSENMRCKTCMFYVSKNKNIGRCRESSPTLKGWPAVYPDDWCGSHKLDETKINP